MAGPNELVETYLSMRERITRLVMRIVPPKEVEDIVQETYVRICRLEDKESVRESRAYLLRTARNLALDHVKRSETRLAIGAQLDELPLTEILAPTEADPTYAQAASDEEFALFCEAVRSLPRQCRRAFVLKKVYGYSLKEIMNEMSLSRPTVETHIVNGTKRCVQYMRERQEESARHASSKTDLRLSTRHHGGVA